MRQSYMLPNDRSIIADDIFLGQDTLYFYYNNQRSWIAVQLGSTFRPPARIRVYQLTGSGDIFKYYLTDVLPPDNLLPPFANPSHQLPSPPLSNEGQMKFFEFNIDSSFSSDRTAFVIINAYPNPINIIGQITVDLL